MIIFRNIPAVFKLYRSLKFLNLYKKGIEEGRAEGNVEKEKENILLATKTWGTKVVEIFHVDLNVQGRENLPKEGPVVYVANHQGYADIVTLCAALDTVQFGFVAKDNLQKVPLYGKWIKRIRSVLMKREDPRASLKAIIEGVSYIEQGFSLLIFPEGTRSKGPEMGSFKKGALKLATKPKVPIVPVAVSGTYQVYETTGKIQGAHVDITILPAIETKELSKQEEGMLSDRVETLLRDTLRRLPASGGKGGLSDDAVKGDEHCREEEKYHNHG